jgi:choline dehydrogenase-like flavoprotein
MVPLPLDDTIIKNKMWQYNHARYGKMYKERIVNAKNIHLYTYANAVDLQTNNTVTEVNKIVVKNYTGKTHTVKAKQIIMACGAIQNTRLLLASNSRAKAGLGNDNDLVGRYFMEHIEVPVADIEMLKPFPTNLYTFDFVATKASAELSITPEVQEKEQILNGTSSFHLNTPPLDEQKKRISSWESFSKVEKHLSKLSNSWKMAEEEAKQGKGNVGKSFRMDIRLEQAPNPNSRVSLSNEKDELGVPRVHMNWDLTPLDKRSIRTIHFLVGKEMAKSGLGRLKFRNHFEDENDNSWPDDTHGGNHHMGTTRMNSDPKKGVVDINCKVHGISNLFIAGSACFPTAGAPNPTLTLTALSIRLSDHIKSIL